MFTGCIRWNGSSKIWSKYSSPTLLPSTGMWSLIVLRNRYQVWSCVGYGDRSMYNCLFAVLSLFRVSRLCRVLSSDRFCRSGVTLHAYVQVSSIPTLTSSFNWLIFLRSSTLNQGVSSHKKIPKEQSWILRQYYGNNIVLFLFCACNELFFVSIYLLSFPPPPNSPPRLGMSPPKTQRSRANRGVGYIRGIPLSYPYLLAFVTFPICAAKNWINVIQMVNAAHALAEVDKEDRAGAGLVSASRPKRSNAGTKSARKT